MDSSLLVSLIAWYVVFLFSTTLHEASHAYAAVLAGDDTAYRAGSATLNPIPHIEREKVGMVIAPLLTFFLNGGRWMFGWASAPFNPYWAARYPRRSFVMSLAGPLSHLVPAFLAWLGMIIGLRTGYFAIRPDLPNLFSAADPANSLAWAVSFFLGIVLKLNAVLLVFNLIPLPPMDGSEIWYLFIKKEESRLRWRYTANSYAFAGLLLAWYFFPGIFDRAWIAIIRSIIRLGTA